MKKKKNKKRIGLIAAGFSLVLLAALCFLYLSGSAKKTATEAYSRFSFSDTAVSFGTYPQTLTTDKALISELNNRISEWTYFNDSFTGEGNYGTMRRTRCMKYADVDYMGNRYRAVMIERYRPATALDPSALLASNQDENGFEEGTVYWFLFEPIRWYAIIGSKRLLLSEKVLDAMPFTDRFYWIDRNFSGGADYRNEFSSLKYLYLPANLWETSSLRYWLNHQFANSAFTNTEKKHLKTTLRMTEGTAGTKRNGICPFTADKVFLLSRDEIEHYFASESAPDVSAVPTDYAKCRGVFCAEAFNAEYSWWWASSPGTHSGDTVSVAINGNLAFADSQFFPSCSLGGIRCAVCLSGPLTEQTQEKLQ